MNFDPYAWTEVRPDTEYEIRAGRLHLRLPAPGALYIGRAGRDVLYGYGHEFRVSVTGDCSFHFSGVKGMGAVYDPEPPVCVPNPLDEVFSNADLHPLESGSMLEVRKALRAFQVEQQGVLATVRRETRKLHDAVAAAKAAQLGEAEAVLIENALDAAAAAAHSAE